MRRKEEEFFVRSSPWFLRSFTQLATFYTIVLRSLVRRRRREEDERARVDSVSISPYISCSTSSTLESKERQVAKLLYTDFRRSLGSQFAQQGVDGR